MIRIGYTCPPMLTEVFIRDFYRVVPSRVSLVITTLAILEMTRTELDASLTASRAAAREMAHTGVDLIVLGGIPINLAAGGSSGVQRLIDEVQNMCGVPVSTSTTAQMNALTTVGAKEVAIAQPFDEASAGMFDFLIEENGLRHAGTVSGEQSVIRLGQIGPELSLELGREASRRYDTVDTLWYPCPHWTVVDQIDEIEAELGLTVVSAGQAIIWDSLRRCGVDEQIPGYGRLMREH